MIGTSLPAAGSLRGAISIASIRAFRPWSQTVKRGFNGEDLGQEIIMWSWSLLDVAPLVAVLTVSVLFAAALVSTLVRAVLPEPRPNLRLIHS